ncbi:MAG: type IV pilus assembly protein PilM [Candidatus Saccharimonadales bacterium]
MHTPLLYKDKPLFAIDIGHSTVKVVQLQRDKTGIRVIGYGYADFDPSAVEKGVITKPDLLVKALKPLLKQVVIGELTTDRAVVAIPTAHIFTRVITLPTIENTDLETAVELEADQYVPLPAEEVHLDYTVTSESTDEHPETMVLMVAAPKKIVASYIDLLDQLDLEVYAMEPSLFAIMRAVNHARANSSPKVVIDFGSESSDLAIYDGNVQLTSTITTGGMHISRQIAETLNIEAHQAEDIMSRVGIKKSKWQEQLAPALAPILSRLADEVQKMLRYHHDHTNFDQPIEEIVIVGGGANLPGLSDFLAHLTGLAVSTCDPWQNLNIAPLQPPHQLETTLYTTAVGLALKEMES